MSTMFLLSCLPPSERTKLHISKPLVDSEELTVLCDFLMRDGYQFEVGVELESCNWFQKNEENLPKRVIFFKSLEHYRTYYLEIEDDGNAYYFLQLHKHVDAFGEKEIEKIQNFINEKL